MKEILKRYDDVLRYQVARGHLMVYSGNRQLKLDNQVIVEDLPGWDFDLQEDLLFYVREAGETHVRFLDTGTENIIEKIYAWSSYVDGVAVFWNGEMWSSLRVHDGQEMSRFTLRSGILHTYFEDYIIHATYENDKSERLLCFDRRKGTYLWEYDVREDGFYRDDIRPTRTFSGQVKSIIGLHDGVLVIAITGDRLLAIDVTTGSKLWQVDSLEGDVPKYLQVVPRLPSAENFKVDAIRGLAISFYEGIYIEIEILTGRVLKTINDYDRLRAPKLQLSHRYWYMEDRYVYYFTDGLIGGMPQLVAYDTVQGEIAWTHVFDGVSKNNAYNAYGLKSMVYDDGLFYVWDINNALTVLKN